MAGNHSAVKVHIDHVIKRFNGRNGETAILNGVDMNIHENEFICVVGPSGCDKSTLLNIIDRLETLTEGRALVDGTEVTGPGPDRGIVFQRYVLFSWLIMEKNVQFGLKLQGKSKEEAEELAHRYLKMAGPEGFAKAYSKELSSGMKQHVAIARTYTVSPKVLLMGEPLDVLDTQTRTQLQQELLNAQEREQKTCLPTIHGVEEAIILIQWMATICACLGYVKEIMGVGIPHLRDQEIEMSPRFLELKSHIWSQAYQEYLSVRRQV